MRTELSSEIKTIRTELRSELGGKIDSMQRDMREFYASQRQHDTRLEAIECKIDPS